MDIQTLIKTDLNLLVSLYILFEERSVSKAADRLFITQSAVSKALSRMRERFGDPLFTRAGHELVPTPYMEVKAPLLIATLDSVTRMLAPLEFRPETYQGQIRVTFPEMIDHIVTPRLLAYLQYSAPGIKIKSERFGEDVLERLATGMVDFAITLEYSHYPPEYRTQHFLSASPTVIARKGHPLSGESSPLRKIVAYPRIGVTLPDESLTEFYKSFAARQGEARSWPSFFETETILSALSIIGLTDSLLPLPDFVADSLISRTSELQKFTLHEYNLKFFNYVIVTHQRVADSPMHVWFGEALKSLGQEIMAAKQSPY